MLCKSILNNSFILYKFEFNFQFLSFKCKKMESYESINNEDFFKLLNLLYNFKSLSLNFCFKIVNAVLVIFNQL